MSNENDDYDCYDYFSKSINSHAENRNLENTDFNNRRERLNR
jgi:hypothetical protein